MKAGPLQTTAFLSVIVTVAITLLPTTAATPRVVVTFRNASLNADAVMPDNTEIIKQYGRRLVLRILEQNGNKTESWVQEALGGEDSVESVELDALASSGDDMAVNQTDTANSSNSNWTTNHAIETSALFQPTTQSLLPSTGWNLDETEPYGLHIQSIRSLTDGRGCIISIIDSGIAEVAKAVFNPLGGYDFISSPDYSNKANQSRNSDYTDPGDQGPACPSPSWHGTKVASVAAAVAPGASLTIMRVLGQCGIGFSSDIADAIVWAAGGQINGLSRNPFPASIISLSLAGKNPCPSYLQSAVNQARSLGAMVITAAGNAAQNVSNYFPSNCNGVIAIGASTRQGTLASYSNWGRGLDFSAPGGDGDNPIKVLSVDTQGALVQVNAMGTSFSSPHVAGFISLVLSLNMQLESSIFLIPFSSCSSNVCGRIISSSVPSMYPRWGMSSIGNSSVSANSNTGFAFQVEACNAVLSDGAYAPGQAGQYHTTDTTEQPPHDMFCSSPCHITSIRTWYGYGFIQFIVIGCSDGNTLSKIGNQGAGRLDEQVTASYPGGFTGINIRGFTDIYAMEPIGLDGSKTANGCKDKCHLDHSLYCPPGKIINGMQIICNGDNIHALRIYCSTRSCPSNYYMTANGYTCATCDSCDAGSYNYNCGGTNSGTCNVCRSSCGDTEYLSGCSGVSSGTCSSCSECSTGNSFGGCTGGDKSDLHTCTLCAPGKYGGGGRSRACTDCGQGKYNPDAGGASEGSCKQCSSGKYNPNSGSVSSDACQNCAAGKYTLNAGEKSCTSCDYGQYSTKIGNNYYCSGCVEGTYTELNGQTACIQCGAGTYNPSIISRGATSCGQCTRGKYSTSLGASSETACIMCEQGKYSSSFGRITCDRCLPGTYGPSTFLTVCVNCDTGTYGTASGLISTCKSCDAGKYNAGTGSSSSASCAPCQAGSNTPSTGMSVCQLCAPGTYAGTGGASSCSPCAAETFTTTPGTVSCNNCVAISNCAIATESRCIANFGTKCVACDFIYACVYQSSSCFVSGSTSNPSCLCSPGFEMVNNICTGCAAGKYKPTLGSNACSQMTAIAVCPKGTYLQQGTAFANSQCVPCPPLPSNSIEGASGCEWKCSAGFDNNAP